MTVFKVAIFTSVCILLPHQNSKLSSFYTYEHYLVSLLHTTQEIDDEEVIETVDFEEFETLFQVKRFKKDEKTIKREESEQATNYQT